MKMASKLFPLDWDGLDLAAALEASIDRSQNKIEILIIRTQD
jgi:hypothetical protein